MRVGFVGFPAGDLSIDQNGPFEDPDGNELMKSVAQPYLYGSSGDATFAGRYGRWLPASVAAVSPDNSHYAYSERDFGSASPSGRIHVVDVTSGADRVVYNQALYEVIAYESEGIYLAGRNMSAPNNGLWLLDPETGSLRQIGPEDQTFYLVGAGGAWYSDLTPGDQAPPGISGWNLWLFADRVLRFDLKSRVVAPWFRRPGKQVHAIGFDSQGHPIVSVSSVNGATSTSEELWLVTTPGVGKRIYSGPGSNSRDFVGFGAPLADSHGLWFGSRKGVFLYTPDGKFQKVSTAVGVVAGRCS